MPREIKFRAKRMDGKEWVKGFYVQMFGKHKNIHYIYTGHIDTGSKGFISRYRVIPETVREWTGLHDRNGKEIYEGDCISFNGLKYVIVWNEDRAGFHYDAGYSKHQQIVHEGCPLTEMPEA